MRRLDHPVTRAFLAETLEAIRDSGRQDAPRRIRRAGRIQVRGLDGLDRGGHGFLIHKCTKTNEKGHPLSLGGLVVHLHR